VPAVQEHRHVVVPESSGVILLKETQRIR